MLAVEREIIGLCNQAVQVVPHLDPSIKRAGPRQAAQGFGFALQDVGANRLRGTIEDINFLGSIVRLRLRLGDGTAREGATTIALDTFNEPHLTLPPVGGKVTVSFPPEACFVLGSGRSGAAAAAEVGAEV